jgi:hypothetical protein
MIRKMNIPTIGESVTLAKDWTFTCIAEYRNQTLMDFLEKTGVIPKDSPRWEELAICGEMVSSTRTWQPGLHPCQHEPGHSGEHNPFAYRHKEYAKYTCTLPRGTRLRVDRIYIRKGKSNWDSLTFWAQDLAKKKVRFFARLNEVNTMVLTDAATVRPVKAKPLPIRAILLRD